MTEDDTSVEKVELFNNHLNLVIANRQLPLEYHDTFEREMLEIAQALANNDLDAVSHLESQSENNIINSTKIFNKRHPSWITITVAILVPLSAIIVACATSPTLRARANEILFQVGHVLFTNKITDAQRAEPYLETPQPTPRILETSEPNRWRALSQDEASQIAGFQVLVPGDIPEQPWEKAYRSEWDNPKKISWKIFESPRGGIYIQCFCFRFQEVFISQQLITEGGLEEFAVADAKASEVYIGKNKGYFLDSAPTGIIGGGGSAWGLTQDDAIWQVAAENILVWEENGVLYLVRGSDELSLSDMLLVANSLTP